MNEKQYTYICMFRYISMQCDCCDMFNFLVLNESGAYIYVCYISQREYVSMCVFICKLSTFYISNRKFLLLNFMLKHALKNTTRTTTLLTKIYC